MKSFAKFMADIPAKYVPKIEESITHAIQVIGDPNSTSEAYEAVAKELADIQQKVGMNAAKAWQGEVAERLKADWIKAGREGIELEKQLTPKITEILNMAEKIRKTLQSSFWAVMGKVALGISAVALVGLSISNGIQRGTGARENARRMQKEAEDWKQSQELNRQIQESQQLMKITRISSDEFQTLSINLAQPEPAQLSPVAAAALPQTIAAVAAQPIQVTFTPPNQEPQHYTQPLGAVYNAMPPAGRQEIESSVRSSPHEWNRTITVTSPVGTFSGCCF